MSTRSFARAAGLLTAVCLLPGNPSSGRAQSSRSRRASPSRCQQHHAEQERHPMHELRRERLLPWLAFTLRADTHQ